MALEGRQESRQEVKDTILNIIDYNNNNMIQQTLDSTGKTILDATCSYARVWPKHATIRIDIRPETKPDIVMDAKELKFDDKYFDEIYCDPPHLFRKGKHKTEAQKRRLSGRSSPGFWERYGSWESVDQWNEFVKRTNIEFNRVLKDDGVLHYKLAKSSASVDVDEFIKMMTNFERIGGLTHESLSNFSKNADTHFIIFRKLKTQF